MGRTAPLTSGALHPQDERLPVVADTLEGVAVRAVACGHDYTLLLCDD
jgi:hypothetical protein